MDRRDFVTAMAVGALGGDAGIVGRTGRLVASPPHARRVAPGLAIDEATVADLQGWMTAGR
ncbi:MAG TPA: hypothetical protein VFX50_00725, partial [Gemmatimonadales bacterium]|nr:hypothetical protein [Gemmatimonadales bacterium]